MKQIISIALILSLGFQCLAKLGIITIYQLNKAYISKTLCENKDRPKLHCAGKCVLKKNLARAERNEKQSAGTEKQVDIPLFLIVAGPGVPTEPSCMGKGNTRFLLHDTYLHPQYIFHPPLS